MVRAEAWKVPEIATLSEGLMVPGGATLDSMLRWLMSCRDL
jgi:hypothetical protein